MQRLCLFKTDPTNVDVAILDTGVSGTATFIALIKEAIKQNKCDMSIALIETSSVAGSGMPYAPDLHPTLKVNDPNSDMMLMMDEPGDFVNWLKERELSYGTVERFAPRRLFGEYCQTRIPDKLNAISVMPA